MFGYIRVDEGELKIRDFGLYRGVYCGLCKTMNRTTGKTSPLTLTYDFVLLALIRSGITAEGFTVRPGKCIAHPIKKRPIAKQNESLEYCAAVSAVLTYYKLLDDKNDKDTKKRILCHATLSQAKRNMKKAFKAFKHYHLEELADKIKSNLDDLTGLENSNSDSPDACSHVFGNLLADCFSHCVSDIETAKICARLGYSVGRWIYLIDLVDDFYKDLKRKTFNPLVNAGFTSLPEMYIKATLTRESTLAYEALCELKIKHEDIFRLAENILTLGMQATQDKILQKAKEKNKHNDIKEITK